MARARIYRRRSDDDQSGYSPQAQDARTRAWCEREGHTVVEREYFDDDISGSREERPAFQRLIADAIADPGSLIVVDKFDRLARDTETLLRTVYKVLKPRGVRVYSASEPIDPYTPIGKMTLTVSGGVSTYHNDNLAGEVKKGLRQKYESGAWVGPLPYGYSAHYDRTPSGDKIRGTGRAVQNDDAPAARLVFELYATGNYSNLSLAEEMNARGYTAVHKGRRVPFQRDTVGGILANKFYLGYITYTEWDAPFEKGVKRTAIRVDERRGQHEPLIDEALWERVQAICASRVRSLGGRSTHRPGDGLMMEYAYCAKCGAVMHWNRRGPKDNGYYWCSCRRRYGASACDARMVAGRVADPLMLDVLRGLVLPATLRDAVLEVVRQRIGQPVDAQAGMVAQLQGRLARLRDLYELGDMDRAEYLKKRTELERQLAQYEQPSARVLDIEHAARLLGDLPTLLEEAESGKRRALVRQIVEAVWLEKDAADQITVTAIKPAASYMLLLPTIVESSMVISTGAEVFYSAFLRSTPLWDAFDAEMQYDYHH